MDRLQREPCHKIFNNYEDQNISLKEKCDTVFSPSEINKFESSALSFNGGEDNTSNEAVFNSSFEPQINATQKEIYLDDLILNCRITSKLNASEEKREEIADYSSASGMSESLGKSQSMITKSLSANLSTHHYIKKITSTLQDQNEKQSFKSYSDASNEEYKATSDVVPQDAILNLSMSESLENIYEKRFLHISNISVSKHPSGNSDFNYGQQCDENYKERQSKNPSEKESDVSDKRENEFTNNFEPFRTEKRVHQIPGTSGIISDAQGHPKDKRFICPFCGKGFRHKYLLEIHDKYRRGEKPYMCDKCGKRYVTKEVLNVHLLIHTGEKSFACHICESRFNRKESLTKHVLTHTGEKPHKCFICAKAYTSKYSLQRHQKLAHNMKFGRKLCREIQMP